MSKTAISFGLTVAALAATGWIVYAESKSDVIEHKGHSTAVLEREVRSKKELFQAEQFYGKPKRIEEYARPDLLAVQLQLIWESPTQPSGVCRALFYEFDSLSGGQ